MPTGLEDNEFLMRCACYSSDHRAMLIHEPVESRDNNLRGFHDEWYLSISLDNFSFWKRVRKGLQYVFSPLSLRYGMTAEIVLRTEDVAALEDFIAKRRNPQLNVVD